MIEQSFEKEILIETSSGNYAGISFGSEDLPTLIAVHGILDNAATFCRLAANLTNNFNLICVDLPSHGKTARRKSNAPYQIVDYIFDLLNIVDSFKTQKVHLLGHCLGGDLITFLAASYPEKVKSLVLLESLDTPVRGDDTAKQIRDTFNQYFKVLEQPFTVYKSKEEVAEVCSQMHNIDADYFSEIAERAVTDTEDFGQAAVFDKKLSITSPNYFSEQQVCDFLRKISCPVLYIRASRSNIGIKQVVERRFGFIENLSIKRVKGPHHVHITNPEAVSDEMLHFYEKENFILC